MIMIPIWINFSIYNSPYGIFNVQLPPHQIIAFVGRSLGKFTDFEKDYGNNNVIINIFTKFNILYSVQMNIL